MKKYYLLLNTENYIQDVIEYHVDGYVEVELSDVCLPSGINAGWYKWNGETYIFDEEKHNQLKPEDEKYRELKAENDDLKKRLSDLEIAMAAMLGGAQ